MRLEEFHKFLKSTHTFVCGITQCGKTTLIQKILALFQKQNSDCKLLIFNTQQIPVIKTLGMNTNSYETTIQSFTQNQTTIYNPRLRFFAQEEFQEISLILQEVFKIQDYYKNSEKQKRVIVVVDEVSQYCHKLYGINVSEFPLITSRGLNPYKINLISISQNIQQTHNFIISQSPNLIFGYIEENDYKLVKSYYSGLPNVNPIKKYYEFYFRGFGEFVRLQ